MIAYRANVTASDYLAREQINFWRNRGITANDAWEALGNARRRNVSWGMVHYQMTGWLLKQDALPLAA